MKAHRQGCPYCSDYLALCRGNQMGNDFSIRFAEPQDAKTFAEWVANNPHIPAEDAVEQKNHKTAQTIVVERDGVPVLFFPLWAIVQVGFLGFNPEADKEG